MSKPVVLIADKLAPSTVDALGDAVEVRWVDGPNTPELLAAIREKGTAIVDVLLHVGLGTFRPIEAARLSQHVMHSEWGAIDAPAGKRIIPS